MYIKQHNTLKLIFTHVKKIIKDTHTGAVYGMDLPVLNTKVKLFAEKRLIYEHGMRLV